MSGRELVSTAGPLQYETNPSGPSVNVRLFYYDNVPDP